MDDFVSISAALVDGCMLFTILSYVRWMEKEDLMDGRPLLAFRERVQRA